MSASLFRVSALGLALGLFAAAGAADDKKDEKPVDLKVGDPAPTFQLPNDLGKSWSSSDHFGKKWVVLYFYVREHEPGRVRVGHFGKKWVVLYFYPGDFTPGCTTQAKAFNAAMDKLTEKGVAVVGVSGDSVQTHDLFKKAHALNFTLLADEDGAVAKQFGVPFGKGATVKARDAKNQPLMVDGKPYEFERKGTAARWTFVVDPDGKIAYKNTKVLPADDAKKIAEFIDKASEKK